MAKLLGGKTNERFGTMKTGDPLSTERDMRRKLFSEDQNLGKKGGK